MPPQREDSSSDKRFRRLVESLDHAIVWEFDDTAQHYTFVSEHSMLVLGYAADDWLRDPHFFEAHVVAEDLPKVLDTLAKLRSGKVNDLRLEHRCLTASGTILWTHTGLHREEENGRTLIRGVTIDINNVKAAEERERQRASAPRSRCASIAT